MASTILPALGSSGAWKLKAPFDTKIIASVAYSCESISSLSALVADGVDVFQAYYVANGLDQATYNQHVLDGISFITLVSETGVAISVPAPYLDGWPSSDVIPYVVVGAVVQLGALPNTIDPAFLTPLIQNVVKNALGTDVTVEYVAMSDVTNKTYSDHQALENARQANIADDNNDYTRRLKAEAALIDAKATIAALQKFIIDSGIPIPVVPG